jgi:hypothetical protein
VNVLQYQQGIGFAVIDVPRPADISETEWLENEFNCDGIPADIWGIGHRKCYEFWTEEESDKWFAVVVIHNDFHSREYIFVATRADRIALRIALAPMDQACALQALFDVVAAEADDDDEAATP